MPLTEVPGFMNGGGCDFRIPFSVSCSLMSVFYQVSVILLSEAFLVIFKF
jgi:hypothetical protein